MLVQCLNVLNIYLAEKTFTPIANNMMHVLVSIAFTNLQPSQEILRTRLVNQMSCRKFGCLTLEADHDGAMPTWKLTV